MIATLSGTLRAWETFRQGEIGYFRDECPIRKDTPIRRSIPVIEKSFKKLRILHQELQDLERDVEKARETVSLSPPPAVHSERSND
jgi:hypothetical protein